MSASSQSNANRFALTSKGQGRPVIWLDPIRTDQNQNLPDQLSQSFHLHQWICPADAPVKIADRAFLMSDTIKSQGLGPVDLVAQGQNCLLALLIAHNCPDQISQLVLQNPALSIEDLSLDKIAARTLILIGTMSSPDRHSCGRALKAALAKSHLIFIHNADDHLETSQPDRTSRIMIDFLNRGEVFLVREQ